jgi:hypothetical protein
MRDLQECKAEVLRRSEQRIRRWRVGRAVAACCIPLALCVTVLVSASLAGGSTENADSGAAIPYVRVYGDGITGRITDPAKVDQLSSQLEEFFTTIGDLGFGNGNADDNGHDGSDGVTDGGLADDLAPVPPGSIPGERLDTYTIKILRSNGRWEWYTLTGNELRDQKSHVTVELTDSQLASLKALLGLL